MPIQHTDTFIQEQNNLKQQIWGKLIPISHGLGSYLLSKNQIIIGRNAQCNIQIKQQRLSNKHCIINKKDNQIFITDISSNGTFLNNTKIGKNNTIKLKNNDQIWLLPLNKANLQITLGFKIQFIFKVKQNEYLQRKLQQQKVRIQFQQKLKQEEKKKQQQLKKANNLAKSIKDQITCSFCFQIMFIPVNVQPCNHRFCGACLTQLVNAKKQQCIQCRKNIQSAVRDSIFNSIIEDYVKNHPDQKRSDKQQQQAKLKNIFGHDPIDIKEKIYGKKNHKQQKTERRGLVRTTSDLSASDDQASTKCRQCTLPRNGFQCSTSQSHINCHTCGKLMANRDDLSFNQSCAICTTNFCNFYLPPCSKTGVKLDLIKNKRQGVKIDVQLLRGNKFQYDALKNYLLSKKQNSKQVFDFMSEQIKNKRFKYLFDKKIMRIPPLMIKQIQLTPQSVICDLCWKDIWFQMVFAYRNIKYSDFPEAVRNRPVCYWGINCRTMDHNQDHARKYNHLIYQTRFS